jgi:DNA-3-methyladenine glycosylase I
MPNKDRNPTGADMATSYCDIAPTHEWHGPYHNAEYGFPLEDDAALFERLVLEINQAGLSWLTILKKREAFRRAYDGFDPEVVARYGARERRRLLADAGIVRNRLKIEAAIANAGAVLELQAGGESLTELLWSFAPASHPAPETGADVPATTPESKAMAKELKRRGFRFVGPTTAYALMQACGLVNDHIEGCAAR